MKTNSKFYFFGYDENEQHPEREYKLLFTSDKASSLYEALKEFEQYEMASNKKFKVVKILSGPPDLEIN